MKVAIVGAGAAGCFCAANLRRMLPMAELTLFERGLHPLAKVAITGGGRCNLTNTFRDITHLQQAYPRGWRLMQRLFREFSPEDTMRWWEEVGVPLVVQDDQCVFPRSQDAMQVVRTLLHLISGHDVKSTIQTQTKVTRVEQGRLFYETQFGEEEQQYDKLVITTGGSPRLSGLSFLSSLDLNIEPPVPSLFAFNIDEPSLHALTGTVVERAHVAIPGTKFQADGPLLITHFGMSGPAILRLSSYAARYLAEQDYKANLTVNWMEGLNEEQVRETLRPYLDSGKLICNHHPNHLTARHWAMLLQRASIPESHRWDCLNRKELNRLINTLTADIYSIQGRRAYKAEFVTCGGISLSNLNPQTLALKSYPDIYLAGEMLDVDGITGGFNLQAAWTMGYVIAKSIAGTL